MSAPNKFADLSFKVFDSFKEFQMFSEGTSFVKEEKQSRHVSLIDILDFDRVIWVLDEERNKSEFGFQYSEVLKELQNQANEKNITFKRIDHIQTRDVLNGFIKKEKPISDTKSAVLIEDFEINSFVAFGLLRLALIIDADPPFFCISF